MIPIAPVRDDVRSAARRQVVAVDVDQAEGAFAGRILAQRQRGRLGCSDKPDRDRTVLPHDPVRIVFCAGDLLRRHLTAKVDGRAVGAEVEALGARLQQRVERGREHVLAGVLLHVVEAA